MDRIHQPDTQPSPDGQVRDVVIAVASSLNRTPRAPLSPTDLLMRINEVVHVDFPDAHPDDLIPKVRNTLPELPDDATCGEFARALRETAQGQQ